MNARPTSQTQNLTEVTPPRGGAAFSAGAIDWEDVHRAIQEVWLLLAAQIQHRLVGTRARLGRTISPLLLFSYCALERDTPPDRERLIVGVDFSPAADGRDIVVRADVCGEESGTVSLELPRIVVPADLTQVRAAGVGLARQLLARQPEIIAVLEASQPAALS